MRRKEITKSIKTTAITAMVYNSESKTICKETYNLIGNYDTDQGCLKALNGYFDDSPYKACEVIDYHTEEKVYRLGEDEFIQASLQYMREGE